MNICEKCGRAVTKHVGPLSTVIQHDDTGRVSCTASGLDRLGSGGRTDSWFASFDS